MRHSGTNIRSVFLTFIYVYIGKCFYCFFLLVISPCLPLHPVIVIIATTCVFLTFMCTYIRKCFYWFFFFLSFYFYVLPHILLLLLLLPQLLIGAIAGLLAARYLAPALVWGGYGESDGIRPDSHAASWAVRREALTHQYVSRLAAQATGKAALATDGDEIDSRQNTLQPGGSTSVVTKNLSQLSAGALQVGICVCVFLFLRLSPLAN